MKHTVLSNYQSIVRTRTVTVDYYVVGNMVAGLIGSPQDVCRLLPVAPDHLDNAGTEDSCQKPNEKQTALGTTPVARGDKPQETERRRK